MWGKPRVTENENSTERATIFSWMKRNYSYWSVGSAGMGYVSLKCLYEMKDNYAIQDTLLQLLMFSLHNSFSSHSILFISKKNRRQICRTYCLEKGMQRTVTIWKTD